MDPNPKPTAVKRRSIGGGWWLRALPFYMPIEGNNFAVVWSFALVSPNGKHSWAATPFLRPRPVPSVEGIN